jgi:16S rRNA A1518/A1519 N6-dimethyltransferase RsmA/KsgA/DIM1 with predicted DNA glycosylase/AP lyase activity
VSGWHAKAYRDAMQHLDFDLLDERPEDLEIEDWLELARLLEDAREAMG